MVMIKGPHHADEPKKADCATSWTSAGSLGPGQVLSHRLTRTNHRMPPGSARSTQHEQHGGYWCAGCNRSWTTLRSLNHHRASPFLRGTVCADEINSRELINIYRGNLATGLQSRLPIISPGAAQHENRMKYYAVI